VTGSFADQITERSAQAVSDSAERENEMLRQMSDVFSELGRLSRDIGTLAAAVHELQLKADAQAAALREIDEHAAARDGELLDTLTAHVAADNQSTEILGRLLQATRSRLEALEDAAGP
jgi:hypothetical protein